MLQNIDKKLLFILQTPSNIEIRARGYKMKVFRKISTVVERDKTSPIQLNQWLDECSQV